MFKRSTFKRSTLKTCTPVAAGSPGRALGLADIGGLALYREMVDLVGQAPSLDPDALHDFADRVARGDGGAYHTVMELLGQWLVELVRTGASASAARPVVAREAAAVIEAYRETLDASRRLLALATAQIQALEVRPSEATPARLKELAEVLRKIHSVQSDIGGLDRSDVWRGPEESSNSDQEHLDTVVRAYLDELEAEETPI